VQQGKSWKKKEIMEIKSHLSSTENQKKRRGVKKKRERERESWET